MSIEGAAAFSPSSSTPPLGGLVTFTDTSSTGSSGPITNWAWDFGDGVTSTLQNPTHAYSAIGSYPVSLLVTFTNLMTSTVSHTLTVTPEVDLAGVIREALDLWQNPPFTELTPEAIASCASRCVSDRFLDLSLTPDACFLTVKSNTFTFASSTDREVEISDTVGDVSRVDRVESRPISSTSEDDWEEERIASFENWNDIMERTDGNYVAIYGLSPSLKMVVNRDVSTLSFRIVYQSLRDSILTPTSFVRMPVIYRPVLLYDMALEFGELIDNQSPEFAAKKAGKMPYLEGRRADALKRVEKWQRSQRGTSPTTRRAFNDRGGSGIQPGRRRFTINF